MDHRFKQQRFSGGYARGVVARARAQGTVQMRNKAYGLNSGNGPPVGGQLDCGKNSSPEGSGTPTETLINEETSAERKINHQQQSVIARLMGLDSMPSPHKQTEQKEFRSYIPQKKCKSYNTQEFKDAFEIKGSKEVEKQKDCSHAKRYNPNAIQEARIKRKFIGAERLSTDENLHISKEFDDALEVLDANREMFQEILKEPNTLSKNHLSGFTLAKQIKVSKLSKGKTRNAKSSSQTHKDPTGTLQKPNTNFFNHPLLERSVPLSHKLEAHNLRKISSRHGSTNVVLLKPNTEKILGRNVSHITSQNRYFYGYNQKYPGTREMHIEAIERHDLLGKMEYLGQKTKSSREIVKEAAKKRSAKNSYRCNRPAIKDESLRVFPSLYNLNNCHQHSENNSSFSNCSSRPSSSYSDKAFLSKEGKKHVPEHWRLHNRLSCENQFDRHFTLSEILDLTGKEGPNVLDFKRGSYHSGLTGKYQYSTSMSRPSSLIQRSRSPFISEGAGCYRINYGLNLGSLENKKPARENLMNHEESENGIGTSYQYTEQCRLSRSYERDIANTINVLDNSLVKEPIISDSKEHIKHHMQEVESSVIGHAAEDKVEEHPHVDNISSQGSSTELEYIPNFDKADNPSPISTIGCQSQEHESSPDSFEKVSAGLQELQIQLQLLRESNNDSTENGTLASSEDDSIPEFNCFDYKNEEDRDYSYVVDALALLSPRAFQNTSIDHVFFTKLEKKYSKIEEWSKSERKLLFDITNSIAETYVCTNRRRVSVPDTKSLNEVVWEKVVRLRKESDVGKQENSVLDPKWLDLEDDTDIIGKEIAEKLMDSLMEECDADFCL